MAEPVLASSMKPHRFPVLDGLRGVAAIIVVTFHSSMLFRGLWFPRGYLAVDFFFMLSGFVLARAYQTRLDNGWLTWEFMKVRLIRVYPLYVLGLAFAIVHYGVLVHSGRSHARVSVSMVAIALNLFLLPAPYMLAPKEYFPFDLPAWSLFVELIMNLIHAALLRKRSTPFLLIVLIFDGLIFAGAAFVTGSVDMGWKFDDLLYLYGFSRVIFSYVLGMLLFRLWTARSRPVRIPLSALPILLVTPMLISLARPLVASDLFTIALIFPLVVLAAAEYQPGDKLLRVATFFGNASFAIYILHWPLVPFIQIVWNRIFQQDMYAHAPWSGLVYMLIAIALAAIADALYDAPVRKFLTRRLITQNR